MLPLTAEPAPHPIFGFNDDWGPSYTYTPPFEHVPGSGANAARVPVRFVIADSNLYSPIRELYTRGIGPLPVVMSVMHTAQREECEHDPACPPAPDHYDWFGEGLGRNARTTPGIVGIEVWNEPNIPQFWASGPDPTAYGEMLREAIPRARAIAPPDVPIVTAGLLPHGDKRPGGYSSAEFLRRAYETGGPQLADAIGAHPYPFTPFKKDYLGAIREELFRIREVMAEFGDAQKPIWVTETGVATNEGYSQREQAEALTDIYNMLRRIENIPVVMFHRFIDRPGEENGEYGVLEANGERKPAYCAIAAVRGKPC